MKLLNDIVFFYLEEQPLAGLLYMSVFVMFVIFAVVVMRRLRKPPTEFMDEDGGPLLAPHRNTSFEDAIRYLDGAEVELSALNIGLANIQMSNLFVTLQSVPKAEKGAIEARVQALVVKLNNMVAVALEERDKPPA